MSIRLKPMLQRARGQLPWVQPRSFNVPGWFVYLQIGISRRFRLSKPNLSTWPRLAFRALTGACCGRGVEGGRGGGVH